MVLTTLFYPGGKMDLIQFMGGLAERRVCGNARLAVTLFESLTALLSQRPRPNTAGGDGTTSALSFLYFYPAATQLYLDLLWQREHQPIVEEGVPGVAWRQIGLVLDRWGRGTLGNLDALTGIEDILTNSDIDAVPLEHVDQSVGGVTGLADLIADGVYIER